MRLGHVNIHVRNAERSRDWYARVLGLHTYHYRPGRAAFMSADKEMSHEVALMQVGDGAAGPMRGQVGLNHMAWMVESLDDLAVAYERLKSNKVPENLPTSGKGRMGFILIQKRSTSKLGGRSSFQFFGWN